MSDIISLVEAARLAHMDNECDDSICTYDISSDSISFKSTNFTEGTVDFTAGTSKDEVVINITVNSNIFKGRHESSYIALLEEPSGFTEGELLKVIK